MSLDDIASITISQNTLAVGQAGYGVALVIGSGTPIGGAWTERIRFYGEMDDVEADFVSTDEEYKAAAALFAQTPCPTRIAIGRQTASVAKIMTITLSADLITANSFIVSVNGTPISATVYATSMEATMGVIAAKIAALTGVASAVVSSTPFRVITVTATLGYALTLTAGAVTLGASQATVTLATSTAGTVVTDELTAINTESSEWYHLIMTSRAVGDVLAAAAWTESNGKAFGTTTSDVACKAATTTDIGAQLNALNYARTYWIWHETPTSYPEAALAGRVLPLDPGTETWMFKNLSGITASNLTATEVTNLKAKNGNYYITTANIDHTEGGMMASGRYIDQTRFVDWIHSQMQEAIYGTMINADKIPYTDPGAAIIGAQVRSTLQEGVRVGGLAADPAFTVTIPKVSTVNVNQKAIRNLPGVTFGATLAGAIHKVTIAGVVSI